ncbi:hypothetical protein WA026_013474 [Henosepilachna vigintioctopunctata]|uniref:Laminin G domain-containing protein n=1 Tax=Henosepilachna vigintioctopunctata TaxID=420089 RepID=A0AAW1VE69_9CUCU
MDTWHRVRVQRHEDRTYLTVDGISQMKTSRGKEFNFGRYSTNSDVYVGGMPLWYNTKLTLLALPSVIFETRFVGAVRNLIYADTEGGMPRRQETRPKDKREGVAIIAPLRSGQSGYNTEMTVEYKEMFFIRNDVSQCIYAAH